MITYTHRTMVKELRERSGQWISRRQGLENSAHLEKYPNALESIEAFKVTVELAEPRIKLRYKVGSR